MLKAPGVYGTGRFIFFHFFDKKRQLIQRLFSSYSPILLPEKSFQGHNHFLTMCLVLYQVLDTSH